MRKLGSFLIILLLITAYGRCVADQLGVLHTTGSTCCQVVCGQVEHCEAAGDDHCDENSTCDTTEDHHGSQSEHPSDTEEPTPQKPCGLCIIISSDSMLLGGNFEVPSPTLQELSSMFFHTSLLGLFEIGQPSLDLDQPLAEHPDPPAEHRSQLKRIVAKTTPVRGPSIV